MAQQFTNFCCRSGGSNLNAGTRTGNDTVPGTSADFTYASGNWVAGTGVFTVASGNPSSDGVAVGDFASVYPNGSTVTPFVGRVTARDATTITVSLTAKSGTAPTNGTGDRTLKVGGAWRGPNSITTFPIDFIKAACTDSTGRIPRVNFKNDVTYQCFTSAVLAEIAGLVFQGFSSSYGDLGKATIEGDSSAPTAYALIVVNFGGLARNYAFKDLILSNNGDEGADIGIGHAHVGLLSYAGLVVRCSSNHNWISSFDFNGICVEGECYDYNFGGSANMAAWVGSALNLRCIAHHSNPEPRPYPFDPGDVNIMGFHSDSLNYACIASNVAGWGFDTRQVNCDAYNCDDDGFVRRLDGFSLNCSATSNGGAGFADETPTAGIGYVVTGRFGTGTQANSSATDVYGDDISGYPTNLSPWVDADNGNFTLFLDDAFETGRGAFTQTAPGYGGSVGYPDIGAARHETHVRNMVLPAGLGGGMA